jgi:hypothetical protein
MADPRELVEIRDSLREIRGALLGDKYRPGLVEQVGRLPAIEQDIQEMHGALYGEPGRKGLIERFEQIAGAAELGRRTLRLALWAGGSIVALLTGVAQLNTAWSSLPRLWGH